MLMRTLPVRHRAAGRPTTALSDFAETATGSLALVGRRSAVVVASSGLLVSAFAMPASAAPPAQSVTAVPAVDTSTLTASARAALDTSPAVSVPANATFTLDVPAVTVVADPPKRSRTAPPASRSTARTAAPTASANVPQAVAGNAVLEIASRYVGVPYVWGGTTPSGFDCSGFTQYVYAQLGVSLPRTAEAQRTVGTVVSRADARPGDLISTPGHIAIYAGTNQEIDAPRPGESIQFRAIWQSNPVFIRVG